MPPNNEQWSEGTQSPEYAAVAFGLGVFLLPIAVLMEILVGKSNHPSHRALLGIVAVVLVSDACLVFAWWRGGCLVRALATLCGLVALLNTYGVLRYTAELLL